MEISGEIPVVGRRWLKINPQRVLKEGSFSKRGTFGVKWNVKPRSVWKFSSGTRNG